MPKILAEFSGWAVNDVMMLLQINDTGMDEFSVSHLTSEEVAKLLRDGDEDGNAYVLPSIGAFVAFTDDVEYTDVAYSEPTDIEGDY